MPASAFARPTEQGLSARRHLALFAVALAVPMLAFVGFLLWQFAEAERVRYDGRVREVSRDLVVALDRELIGLQSTLRALATSPALEGARDLAAFHRQASEVRRIQGFHVVLRDLERQQLINTRVPWGKPLPRGSEIDAEAQVVRTKQPAVSNVFVGAVGRNPIVAVVSPVMRGDEVVGLLNVSVDAERFRDILDRAGLPDGWTASIVDRNDNVVARSVRHEESVGKPASANYRSRKDKGKEGSWTAPNPDGVVAFAAYVRSDLAGWYAVTGVPVAQIQAPLRGSLWLFAGLGAGLAALSTALALLFGQRVTEPVRALSDRALALGQGLPVEPLRSRLREANRVGEALVAADASLRERASELRESNEEVQRFAYIVSHDLRAPLVNIMGFTSELETLRGDLFKPGGAAPAGPAGEMLARDFDEAIGFIKAAISKMDGLIGAILKISREGRRTFRPEPLEMTGLVRGLAASVRHQTEAAGAVIEVAELPGVTADRLAIDQIFGNLLDNAVKYLSPDRPGRIEISGRDEGRSVVYEVRDNGRGIAAVDQARVFELFRRAGTQDQQGDGIGLEHVRALLRSIGGRIDLSSEFGVGTTFTVTLPKRPSPEPR